MQVALKAFRIGLGFKVFQAQDLRRYTGSRWHLSLCTTRAHMHGRQRAENCKDLGCP